MINVFKKEIAITISPIAYILFFTAVMLLIPTYPYVVGVSYVLFFLSLTINREYKDTEFMLILPLKRDRIVMAKHFSVIYLEILQLLVAIPFAIINRNMYADGNAIFMNAGPTFFGAVLVAYGFFNLIFLTSFFKTGYKIGIPYLIAIIVYLLIAALVEIIIILNPAINNAIDSLNPQNLPYEIIVLAVGIGLFVLLNTLSYKISVKRFNKVDL